MTVDLDLRFLLLGWLLLADTLMVLKFGVVVEKSAHVGLVMLLSALVVSILLSLKFSVLDVYDYDVYLLFLFLIFVLN